MNEIVETSGNEFPPGFGLSLRSVFWKELRVEAVPHRKESAEGGLGICLVDSS